MKCCSVKDWFSPSLCENVILHFVKEQWLTLVKWKTNSLIASYAINNLKKSALEIPTGKNYGSKGHDQFTKILFKPVMINNVEDIAICVDRKVFNSDSYNNLFLKRKLWIYMHSWSNIAFTGTVVNHTWL